MQSAYVIGLGQSGVAAARLLKREGWQVTISDRNTADSLLQTQQQLAAEGIAVKLRHTFEPNPTLMQRVVVSPGVRWDLPALVQARELGIEIIGEVELAWRSLQSYPWVGITGTNGKTTTTALIAAIFQAAGLNAPACGNIGYATCEVALTVPTPAAALNTPPLDWVIAELSSYQIEASSSIAPQIGVWTTFTPDHLNRHYTLENYFNIKAQLLDCSRYRVLNGDDPYLRQTLHNDKGDAEQFSFQGNRWQNTYWTSVTGKASLPDGQGAYIQDGWAWFQDEAIVPVSALRMVGEHNQQNLLMAVATARLAGIPQEAIAQAVHDFPGVPHRLEHIRTWNGIQFINDSKATNYDAAQVGLSAVESPVILIAGGEAKAGDDTAWLQTIQAKVATVLLIGSAAIAFAQRLKEATRCEYEVVETMEQAVKRAAMLAQQTSAKVVLLSPACASFDQYQNFEQRGDHFRQLCLAL